MESQIWGQANIALQCKVYFQKGGHDPSFYIMSKEKVRFHFDQNGKNTHQDFTGSPPLEKWTKMEFKQEKEGSAYFITISMGEKILFKSENSTPEDKADIDVIGGTLAPTGVTHSTLSKSFFVIPVDLTL